MRSIVVLAVLIVSAQSASAEVLRLDYEGFTVWLDCDRRGAIRFEYVAAKDTGNLPRKSTFKKDLGVPDRCQQTSTGKYHSPSGQPTYDMGHLVPADHFDHSETAIAETNYITNILPQVSIMNRQAWGRTEYIIDCYRDLGVLHVYGGVIWGTNPDDDFFLQSHGVATPDAFWKVVIGRTDAIAWIIHNEEAATNANLDMYLVSIAEVEALTGETFPVPVDRKVMKPKKSWPIPKGCKRG